jgi:hypothetical protein
MSDSATQAKLSRVTRPAGTAAGLRVAVLLELASQQGRDGELIVGITDAAADEVVGQGAGLFERLLGLAPMARLLSCDDITACRNIGLWKYCEFEVFRPDACDNSCRLELSGLVACYHG